MIDLFNTKTKRLSAVALALCTLVFVFFGSMQWSVRKQTVEEPLKKALQRDTAYELETFGPVQFSAFPWPTLYINHLVLNKGVGSVEKALIEKLQVRLNLASWLLGEPRIVEMRVEKADIYLASTDKLAETEAVSTAVLNFLTQGKRPDLRSLRIVDSKIFRDEKLWVDELAIKIHNIAASDLRFSTSARIDSLPVAMRADVSQGSVNLGRTINWHINLPGLESEFYGLLLGSRSFDADGISKTVIVNGRNYAQGLGLSSGVARLFDQLTMTGATRITWPSVQMKQAQISFDQNTLDGSVELYFDKSKPSLSATLAADKIDLNSRLAAWTSNLPENSSPWSEDSVAPDWLNAGHADIRLSAEKVLLGSVTMEAVALASQLRDGRFDIILSEAKYKKGQLRGRGQLRHTEGGFETRTSLNFDQIDLEGIQGIFGLRRVKGLASGMLSVEAKGATPRLLMQTNSGKGNLNVRNGEFVGLDIERLVSRVDRSNLSAVTPSGSTRFRSFTSEFQLASGTVSLHNSVLSTFGLNAPLEGSFDLNKQSFDLAIRLMPIIPLPRLTGSAIRITGPWSKPVFSIELPQGGSKS